MGVRTSVDGPDLPQTEAPEVVVDNPDLPKLEAPEWGKVEKRIDPPTPCFVKDRGGGRHRAQIVGMECDSGIAPPAGLVCRSCRHAFDDPAQGGISAALVRCPKCKKKGVEIYPASALGVQAEVVGGGGNTVYLVEMLEAQTEVLEDDPSHPGRKLQRTAMVPILPKNRTTITLTGNRIELR